MLDSDGLHCIVPSIVLENVNSNVCYNIMKEDYRYNTIFTIPLRDERNKFGNISIKRVNSFGREELRLKRKVLLRKKRNVFLDNMQCYVPIRNYEKFTKYVACLETIYHLMAGGSNQQHSLSF